MKTALRLSALAALLGVFSGCVNVRIHRTPTIKPSNALAAQLLPALETATLDAELQLPRSRYSAIGESFSVDLRPGTKAVARVHIPADAITESGELIVAKVEGSIDFNPGARVKIGGFPAATINRISTTDGVMLDVFQTLVTVAFTLGRPAQSAERLPGAATLLGGTKLKEISLKLKPDRQITLPAAPNQPPTVVRIGSGAELFLQYLALTGKPARGRDRVSTPGGGVVSWAHAGEAPPMSFAGDGQARLSLRDVQASNPDEAQASIRALSTDVRFHLSGGDGKPPRFTVRESAAGADLLRLDALELRLTQGEPARAAIDALQASVKSAEFVFDAKSGRLADWHAHVVAPLGGKFAWDQKKVAVAGQLSPKPLGLAASPGGFAVELPEGLEVVDAQLAVRGGGDQTEISIPLLAFGPTAYSKTNAATLASIGPLDLRFSALNVRGTSGYFGFDALPAGRLHTDAPLVLGAHTTVPDIHFELPQGRGVVSTRDKGEFKFGPVSMSVHARDLSTSPIIKYHASVEGSGRVPIESVGLASLHLKVAALDGQYEKGRLKWSMTDGRLGLQWADLVRQLNREGLHGTLGGTRLGVRIFPVALHGLREGQWHVRNLKLRLEGTPAQPQFDFDADYSLDWPIDYEVWGVSVKWELRKIGFIKTHLPVVRGGWEPKPGHVGIHGRVLLRDFKIGVLPGATLADTKLDLSTRIGGTLVPHISGDLRLLALVGTAAVIASPVLAPVLVAVNMTSLIPIPVKKQFRFEDLKEPWSSVAVAAMGFTQWDRQTIEFAFSGSGESLLNPPTMIGATEPAIPSETK